MSSNTSPSPRLILSAMGRNRAGILAEITTRISELNGNIHDITQKIMGDYFMNLMVVELEGGQSFDAFKQGMARLSRDGDYTIVVQNEKVFHSMHRI